MTERHIVLTEARYSGFPYGVQQHFENEIARVTGAARVAGPYWSAPRWLRKRLAHGTRYAPLRRAIPRTQPIPFTADVVWTILMGPENTDLDLLARWDRKVGYRILYLFDTFPYQIPVIRRLLQKVRWDLTVTSFHAAVPMLERETQRRWHAVAQGVTPTHFTPLPGSERAIAFSAYGRRLASAHCAMDAFTLERGLHYDTTIAASVHPELDPSFLYRQYAWHLQRSWFTTCWPVELTHPHRAGALSPVTCRWFEAAASGVPMIGRAPSDPVFQEFFGQDAVLPLEPNPSCKEQLLEQLDRLWQDREQHLQQALARRAARLQDWTWERRVRDLLALAGLNANVDATHPPPGYCVASN